jgi:(2Fe-2S) ferredoxin
MRQSAPRFQKYLFVCENQRESGACCMPEGARIRERLKDSVKSMGLSDRIRVSRSGCLDACAEGPNVLLMPDNKWFNGVCAGDVDEIVREARKGLL